MTPSGGERPAIADVECVRGIRVAIKWSFFFSQKEFKRVYLTLGIKTKSMWVCNSSV